MFGKLATMGACVGLYGINDIYIRVKIGRKNGGGEVGFSPNEFIFFFFFNFSTDFSIIKKI